MFQVIDYQDGAYELHSIDRYYSSREIMIDDMVFTLFPEMHISLSEIPASIKTKWNKPSEVGHYESTSGEIISIDEFKQRHSALLRFKVEVDDDEYMWETREDKERYDSFLACWKAVYSIPAVIWEPVEFQIVKQEKIPDRYKDFISASFILDTTNNKSYKKSICYYKSSPWKMMKMIAERIGLSITKIDNRSATIGKVIYIHGSSPLEFSQINGEYIRIDKDIRVKFGNITGTLDQCVGKFEFEYQIINDLLTGIVNVIDNKAIAGAERKELLDILDKSIGHYRQVDPYKSCRISYRMLGQQLTELRNKLTMISGQ